mmetsp:Transcript_127957/g.255536  ORF Transcript_127957/g.255536 Transcript_127957/m.255536 type:complete len:473 (-) Transcript_127957:94-1512(-)
MADLWPLGVSLEVLATLSGTAGKQLIRLSELWSTVNPHAAKVVFSFGMITNTVAGPILDMAAYSFAAQSLIAPFGGLDTIWNAALAPWLLKEKLTLNRLFACCVIFIGTVLSGVFGSHEERDYSVEVVHELLVSPRILYYLTCVAAWVAFNILVPMRRPRGDILRGLSLGVTAGSIAGNMFCVKAGVELIERSIWKGDSEVWRHWLTYATLLGAAFFALTNLIFMTRGLLEFEALFMVTIYEGAMIVSNCVSAGVVLRELHGLESWRVASYTLCVLLICLGMAKLCIDESTSQESAKRAQADRAREEAERAVEQKEVEAIQSDEFADVDASDARAASLPHSETLSTESTTSSPKDEQQKPNKVSAIHCSAWRPTEVALPVLASFPAPSYSEPIRIKSKPRSSASSRGTTPRTDQDEATWTEAEDDSELGISMENVVAPENDGQMLMDPPRNIKPQPPGCVCGVFVKIMRPST